MAKSDSDVSSLSIYSQIKEPTVSQGCWRAVRRIIFLLDFYLLLIFMHGM